MIRTMSNMVRILLVLFGLAALFAGYRHLALRATPGPQTEMDKVADIARADKATLLNRDAREPEIFGALVRLGQREEPLARQEAVKRAESSSKMIREGVANALGFFDDAESFEKLRKLVADPEKEVRIQALVALGRRPSDARRALLREIAARPGLSAEEKVAANSSLAKLGGKGGETSSSVAALMRIALTDHDDAAATRAASEAVSLAPRDPKVLEMLRSMLENEKREGIRSLGVRHLAVSRDPWMLKNYRRYLDNAEPGLRMAVVQSLHFLCPDDRWSTLDKVISGDRDKGVVMAALQEPRFMPGNEAKALLQRLIAGGKLAREELTSAQSTLAELEKSTAVDPCLNYRERRE